LQVHNTTAIQNYTTTNPTSSTDTKSKSGSAAGAQATLDYNAFLNLLIAQMKNQDPTNPADPAQWMGQIASFSNVEQAIQTNAKLDSMMTQMSLTQVDGLIGRTITSMDTGESGTIAAVQVITGGSVAILSDGTQMALGDGVVIS
jgi:flagellar basal-body rod modification protein FlgD